jgi:endo-1,4-beta-D-glucanase Y
MKFRGCTVSEGIGYGMLIAAMQNDEPTFITLWNYSRGFRAYNNNQPLTPWITFSFTFNEIDLGSATDADLDIATSLILMYLKTLNVAYLNDALVIAGGIWDHEVKDNLLLSGDTRMWDGTKGPIVYNLSYFSPVALRLFAKYDTAHNWTAVLDAMYTYMATIQAKGTGVFPDWSTATSSVNPPNDAAGNEKSGFTYYTFNKESVRIPWRIAWDYYWFQDPRAFTVLQTLNQFIVAKSAGDPNSAALAVNYSWDPSLGPDNTRNTAVPSQWLAAWCATGIGTNTQWLESCTKALNGKTVSNTASSYFPDILLVMYSQLLNGQYTRPAI